MDAIAAPRPLLFHQVTGSGAPVLLIHGLLTDSGMWAPVADRLARSCRVIRCDLRGRGQSARAAGWGPIDHVSDLAELVEHLRLPAVHLAGYGSGCPAAVGLAVGLGRRALSLTVIDPVIPRSGPRAVQENWHLEMLLQWLAVGHGPAVRQPEHVAALQAVIAQQTHAQFDGDPTAAESPNRLIAAAGTDLAGLAQLACPVQALIGQRAEAELVSVATTMFGQARDFQLRMVPGAARRSPLEAPDDVAAMLAEFLRTIEP